MTADDRTTQRLALVARHLESSPLGPGADRRTFAASGPLARCFNPGLGEIHPVDEADYSDLFDEPRGRSLGAAYVGARPISQAEAFYRSNGKTHALETRQGMGKLDDVNRRRGQSRAVGANLPRRSRLVPLGVAAIGTVVGFALVMLWERRYDFLFGAIALIIALLP